MTTFFMLHKFPGFFKLFHFFLLASWHWTFWNVTCEMFRNCGGTLKAEHGFIHSPNFPDPYPDPISCTWVIRAPAGKKIHLYFTQYFLREALYLSAFDTYTSPHTFTGHTHLGQFDFVEEVSSIVIYQPVLTVEFHARGKKNIHLRVEEFLTDVYGFNITYEIVDVGQPKRNITCSVHECSFLGHCYVAADWAEFQCVCFDGYFGAQCEYGPYCDPQAGLNTCQNGGSCRYFYGSEVNMCHCPPGFTGVFCETSTDIINTTALDNECARLGCSQLCDVSEQDLNGAPLCSCREGFRLMDDNTTCQLIEMHRVMVNLLTRDTNYSQQNVLSEKFARKARRELNRIFLRYRLPVSERFHIDGFREITASLRTLSLEFFVESQRAERVSLLLNLLAMKGRLFNFTLVSEGLQVVIAPELHLLEVENYEKRAARESGYSNLLCRARGSKLLQFRWYKDGRFFNTSLTTRNVWNSIITEPGGDTHMAILNINDITIYDKGVFTCEVEDYGLIQKMTVALEVLTSPRVVITPLVANIRQGESTIFRCYTPDEREFTYTWLKNSEAVGRGGNTETVEDVLPTGKRLNILHANISDLYTCAVTGHMITASASVHLFVAAHRGKCEGSESMGVIWQPAVHGGMDIQKCPKDIHGVISRSCRCGVNGCQWSPPNMALCQTPHFIALYDKMEQLLLGYQGRSIKSILAETLDLLSNGTSRSDVIAGDVTLASRMMLNGLTSAVAIPDLLNHGPDRLSSKFLLDTLAILIDWSVRATAEEQKEQRVMCRSLMILELIAELMGSVLPLLPAPGVRQYATPVFVATIKEYGGSKDTYNKKSVNTTHKSLNESDDPGNHLSGSDVSGSDLSGSRLEGPQPRKSEERQNDISVFLFGEEREEKSGGTSGDETFVDSSRSLNGTNATEAKRMLNISSGAEKVLKDDDDDKTVWNETFRALTVVHLGTLELLDPPASNNSHGNPWVPLSRLQSVLPVGTLGRWRHFRTKLTFHHPVKTSLFELNETVCFAFVIRRNVPAEHWSRSQCQVTHSGANLTTCLCSLPAHVAVFVRSRVDRALDDDNASVGSTILLLGCIVALCGLFTTLMVYLYVCGGVRSVFHMIRVNVMVSLLAVLAVCISCLQDSHHQAVCVGGRLLLQLTLLGVYSFLFVDSIHMYVAVHALTPRVLVERCGKFLAIGWGIPLLSVGSTALTAIHYGHSDQCYRWCWVESRSWQFYPFLIPTLSLMLMCVLICIKCTVRVNGWTDEWRFRDRKKHIFRGVKNVSILIVLTGVTWAGCDVEKKNTHGVQIVFVILLVILVGLIFAAYFMSERRVMDALYVFATKGTSQPSKKSSSNSFRAFVMPEKIEGETTRHVEEQTIHRLCTYRNNTRYTHERKRQLRFLLGSGSTSDKALQCRATSRRDDARAERVVVYLGRGDAETLARELRVGLGANSHSLDVMGASTSSYSRLSDQRNSDSISPCSEMTEVNEALLDGINE